MVVVTVWMVVVVVVMVVWVVVVVLVVGGGGGVSGRDSFQTTVFAKLRKKEAKVNIIPGLGNSS